MPRTKESRFVAKLNNLLSTFLNLKDEIEGWVLEKCLNHLIVRVVEDGFDYSSYHTLSHFISFILKFFEHFKKGSWKGRVIQ